MSSLIRIACAALLGTSTAFAQFVEINPNPVSQNSNVTFVVTDTTGSGIMLPSPCTWLDVHQGSQTGPLISTGIFCGSVIVNVPANGSASLTWDLVDGNTGLPVPPGRYWIQTRIFDGAFNTIRNWFCFDVVAPGSSGVPSLVQLGPANVGQVTQFRTISTNQANEPFAMLLSFDQELPLSLPGFVDLCISDPVFLLQSGSLDGSGFGPLFPFQIPNMPTLAFTGFHLQSLIVDTASLTLTDTNAQPVLIRP